MTTKIAPVTMDAVIERFGPYVPNLSAVERMRLAAQLQAEIAAAAATTPDARPAPITNEVMERLYPGYRALPALRRLALGNSHMLKVAKAAAAAAKKKVGEP